MKAKVIEANAGFIGRRDEIEYLNKIAQSGAAAIVVVHGRRRVGKTELVEQVFRRRNLLKFEGVEGQNEDYQRQVVMKQLAEYTGDTSVAALRFSTWLDVFKYIARYVKQGTWTLFFEELQWLSCYNDQFISELKFVWDNEFRYNNNLLMVLCGSAPSFMVGKVLHSNALYNRSVHELPLAPFSLIETQQFLGEKYTGQEVMDAYLSVGGIPEYLRYLKEDSSVFLSLCQSSFTRGGFFSSERDRVFVSSLAGNKHYAHIVDFLSRRRYATRAEIAGHLKIDAGGSLTDLLNDLEQCGFIEKFTPYNLGETSKLARYAIADNYLQFYYKFIHPKKTAIRRGEFNNNPPNALVSNTYYTWLGYAFERYCRSRQRMLASLLGFGAVQFRAGPFYNRNTEKEMPGYQIDLVFERNDRVFTVCEIKYLRSPASGKVIADFDRKLALFPNPRGRSIHKVLISACGADESLKGSGYFDRIINLEDLFKAQV